MNDTTATLAERDARETLLHNVAKALAEAGGLGLSMAELAKRVGVSRPTLYYHFNDKTDIMSWLVEDIIAYASDMISQERQKDYPTAREALFELCRRRTLSIIRKRYNFQLLVHLDKNLPESVRGAHDALKMNVLRAHRDLIERGMHTGEFALGDPNTCALAVIGTGNWAAWWVDETRGGAETIARTLADLSVKSLLATPHTGLQMTQRADMLRALGRIESATRTLRDTLE